MKDTVITAAWKKREWTVLLLCFLVANLFNISAIILYQTSWDELFTQWYIVLIITILLYLVYWVFRVLIQGLKNLIRRPGN